MTQEEREAYEGYFNMFSTKGWKLVTDQLATELENTKNELVFKAEGDLNVGKLRGKAEVFSRVLGLENQVEAMFNQAKTEAKDDGDTV